KGEEPDNPAMELPVAASAPVVGLPAAVEVPIPADAPVVALGMASDAGAGEAPAHVAPINGEAPNVVGLTPGVASSVAPMGTPVCPTGAFGTPRGDVMPSDGKQCSTTRAHVNLSYSWPSHVCGIDIYAAQRQLRHRSSDPSGDRGRGGRTTLRPGLRACCRAPALGSGAPSPRRPCRCREELPRLRQPFLRGGAGAPGRFLVRGQR